MFLQVARSGLHVELFRVWGSVPLQGISEVVTVFMGRLESTNVSASVCDGGITWRGRARCWQQAAMRLGLGSAASSW